MNKFIGKLAVVLALIVILLMGMALNGCTASAGYNRTLFDTTYKFDTVQIAMPNGDYVIGNVENWTDWEDSDAIQVTVNGTTYYTHLSNVVLMAKK